MGVTMDPQVNFAAGTVATAPSPATSGTSLVLTSGHGARFPAVPFNATITNGTSSEIVRVTARSTDTLTIVRAQEGFSARSIAVGDQVIAGATKKTWDDARDQHGMDVRTVGALGDATTGTSANNAAWLSVLNSVVATRTALPLSASPHPHVTKTIRIPAGVYTFTSAAAFLGQEGLNVQTSGLHFEGEPGATHIIFKPTSAADFMAFDYWWNVSFRGISFYSATAGSTLMHVTANNSAQRFHFDNCSFYNWKYIAYLEGGNNNSEWFFNNCHSYFNEAAGAWLRIPSTGSDQFLNYWWIGCTHWSTSAPLVDADKGGHFKVFGLDVSDYGTALSAPGPIFKLKGNTHSAGVCNLQVEGIRVEAKNNNCQLLYSEWPYGTVSFSSVDWSSQAYSGSAYTYGNIIDIVYGNIAGASYTFRDSALAGGVKVGWGPNGYQVSHRILFEDCEWWQKSTPYSVVTYDTTNAGGNNLITPPVEFVRCRPQTQNDPLGGTGQAIWDATIGWKGDLARTLTHRVVSLRGVYGTTSGTDVDRVILPVGALITHVEAMSPAGTSAESDGGTWTLLTTDGSPVTVATLTVSGAMSAGFVVGGALATPFDCSTLAKATLRLTATNVSTANPGAVVLIRGYW